MIDWKTINESHIVSVRILQLNCVRTDMTAEPSTSLVTADGATMNLRVRRDSVTSLTSPVSYTHLTLPTKRIV